MNVVDEIITEHEEDLRNFREGIQETVFLIACIGLFVWGCWVFV